MSNKARRVLAIIALCIMPFFVASLTLALGFSDFLGGSMPAVAGVTGCLVLLIFVFLKMDANRTERKLEQQKLEQTLAEGERRLDEEIEQGTAINVSDDPDVPAKEPSADAATDAAADDTPGQDA